jgi:hypothetical protein
MKFVCMGFLDESQWENLSAAEGQKMMQECCDHDDELRRGGHFLGGEALSSSRNAVTLRFRNGQIDVSDGPFTETKEVLGGILLLEARDLNHAISLISRHPGMRIGPWEIRAADEQVNALIAERDAAFALARRDGLEKNAHSVTTLRAALKFSYEWIKLLADDLADAPLTSPTPGPGNHPLWIMGHLVFSSSGLLSMISGADNPYESWKELFEGGTQPVPNAAHYPAYVEILSAYEATHRLALALLDKMTASRLEERPPAVWEALRDDPGFQTIGQIFLFITMHEMSHRGQLADARRALGRKPFA